jgi:ABC-type nickel/cobalt efflux system permease component RcnA
MIIGLLLILVAIVVAIVGVAFNGDTGPSHPITVFGQQLLTLNGTELFLAGIAAGVVFCLGLWMVAASSRRRRATRADLRTARKQAADATQERDELAARLGEPAVVADPRPQQHYTAPVEPSSQYADGTGVVDPGRHVTH